MDINRIMCPAYPVCDPVLDGRPVWRDAMHYLPSTLMANEGAIWKALTQTGDFQEAK